MSDAFNHRYLASQAERFGGRVLDFGCGRANVVRLLRSDGVDAYGADVFFGGMDWGNNGPDDLLATGVVRTIVEGRLPFEDDHFDAIVSDQVIEHIDDLDMAVREMSRVLRPGGTMYHQYPTLEVVREAHTGLPWAHRLPPRFRVPYLQFSASAERRVRRKVEPQSPREYADHMSAWIDEYCRYRPRVEIEAAFTRHGFGLVHREPDYCRARAQSRRVVGLAVERLPSLAGYAFQRLGFDCVEVARSEWASAPRAGGCPSDRPPSEATDRRESRADLS